MSIGYIMQKNLNKENLLQEAEAGIADAQYKLGKQYYDGELMAHDPKKGFDLIYKAANQGHHDALQFLSDDHFYNSCLGSKF